MQLRVLGALVVFASLGGIALGQFSIVEAPRSTANIDGSTVDWGPPVVSATQPDGFVEPWEDIQGQTFTLYEDGYHMGWSWRGGGHGGDPESDPIELDIRYSWDDDNLYILVEETAPDDDPAEGDSALDWCQECVDGGATGPAAPWNTDSVGFYDKGIKWPDGEDLNVLAIGPLSQFWVGLSSDPSDGELRHLSRSFVEGGSARLIGPDSQAPDVDDIGEVTDVQSAFTVKPDGTRVAEFFMRWDQIRWDENDLDALEGHTLQDVKAGYEFRLEPLVVDGLDAATFGSQTHPSGAEHPHPDANVGMVSLDQVSVIRLSAETRSDVDIIVPLRAGDSDQDLDFDQLDLIKVQQAGKYLTGEAATWGDGDWDGAPGGQQAAPPAGDGLFNQIDIIAALGAGTYLTGPYGAVASGGQLSDGQTSVVYDAGTGEVSVDAAIGTELTSINIDSAAGIFTGEAAANLGGSFDNDADGNIFKATFGSSFGSLSFGNVAQPGLSEDFLLNDLTVVGSLAGGGDLGEVDLVYVPEPVSALLLAIGLVVGLIFVPRSHD